LVFSPTPLPTLVAVLSATPALPPTQPVTLLPPTETPGPWCDTAKAGDTLVSIAQRYGYRTLDVVEEIRRLNGIVGNNIQEGQRICVPRPTLTPSPRGFDATQTEAARFFPTQGGLPQTTAVYTVKEGDDLLTILFSQGVSLRDLCRLNSPERLDCGGCNLNADRPGCRPIIRFPGQLFIPGPTVTPTVTPTYSGSETATATPGFLAPQPLSPTSGKAVRGPVQLLWLADGILQPDEYYLVTWSDNVAGTTFQRLVREPALRLPAELLPSDGRSHVINWQVGVVRVAADSFVLISSLSVISTFTWEGS
jgi:LysM repeat protein